MLLCFGLSACDNSAEAQPSFFSQMTRVSESHIVTSLEEINVGHYSYRLVDNGERQWWIVAMQSPKSKRIRLKTFGRLKPFYSKRLKRTFEQIDFAVISAAQPEKK